MSFATLSALREAYPGRVYLRVEEVAHVLRGKATKKVKENVRKKIQDGSYGPGGRVVDGVWQLPLTTIAEVLEPSPSGQPLPTAVLTPSRRRSRIGPYVTFVRLSRFFSRAYLALGEQEEAQALLAWADEAQIGRLKDAAVKRASLHEEAIEQSLRRPSLKGRGPPRM